MHRRAKDKGIRVENILAYLHHVIVYRAFCHGFFSLAFPTGQTVPAELNVMVKQV